MTENIRLPDAPMEYDRADQDRLRRQLEMVTMRLGADIEDARVNPRVFDILVTFDNAGAAYITVKCNPDTLSFRFATSDAAPLSLEEVQAAPLQVSSRGQFFVDGPFQAGEVLHIGVLPYSGVDGDGTEGPLYAESATFGTTAPNEVRAVILAADATTVTVRVTANTGVIGRASVTMVALTGAVKLSGLDLMIAGPSPQVYVFERPAASAGDGIATFRSRFPEAPDDEDVIYIPEQGKNLLFLGCRASIIDLKERTAVIRTAVADPIPQGADTVDLNYTYPLGTPDPASPQTVTPAATYSGAEGTFLDVEVERDLEGIGQYFEVVATSNSAPRIADADRVRVPARAGIPASLAVEAIFTDDDCSITAIVGDTDTLELSINNGAFAAPPSFPIVVTRQPASGGADQFYTFRSTGELGDFRTETVRVVRRDVIVPGTPVVTSVSLLNGVFNCDGSGSFEIHWTVDSMPMGVTYKAVWEIVQGFFIGPTGGTIDPATTPETVNTDLCDTTDTPTARVTVTAYDGATPIAQRTIEEPIGT
jgi:hypothetical protein